ncbi:molecular chaperone GrpE (heat shock protein) [Salinibacter ruber]|nr:molecular chaperone GrpE (heat shock protein) [Salinibacter ruber]
MSRSRLLLPLLAVLFILGACQSEGKLTGEVFIVTEGRENIEMGLVEVKAFQSPNMDEYIRNRYDESKSRAKHTSKKVDNLLDSLRRLGNKFESIESKYDEVKERKETIMAKYKRDLMSDKRPAGNASSGDKVAARTPVTLRERPKFSSDKTGGILSGDVAEVVSVEEKSVNTFYKLKTEDGNIGWTGYIGDLMNYERFEDDIRSSKERVEDVKKDYMSAKKSMSNMEERAETLFERLESYRGQKFYFKALPSSDNSDETDSDGKYELTVEGGVSYYVVAHASRSTGVGEEQYFWMVETTVEGDKVKELNLANDKLGSLAEKKYALSERTLSTVKEIWDSAVGLAKKGEELEWEKLIYRTAFPKDTTDAPIPDDLDVPEEELFSDR